MHVPYTVDAAQLEAGAARRQFDALLRRAAQSPGARSFLALQRVLGTNMSLASLAEQCRGEAPDLPSVTAAAAQEALDLSLACAYVPPKRPPAPDSLRNRNWHWDGEQEPVLPEVSLATAVNEPLSDSARLLLSEWPLGSSATSYAYASPYAGLDFDSDTQRSKRPMPGAAAVLPTVGRANRAYQQPEQVVSSASQPVDSTRTSATPAVQTQVEPGRFAKRKRRMGGF